MRPYVTFTFRRPRSRLRPDAKTKVHYVPDYRLLVRHLTFSTGPPLALTKTVAEEDVVVVAGSSLKSL